MQTIRHLEWIESKVLLGSTGSSDQSPGIDHEDKHIYVYVYICICGKCINVHDCHFALQQKLVQYCI